MNSGDPTDHALATIASILDRPMRHAEPEKVETQARAVTPEPIEADGYSKTGPGPMAAIRFKWTVHRGDNDEYYVHETIGDNSAPVVSGPMSGGAAIAFVDECESNAHRRFEQLTSEMAGRAAAAALVRKDGGKI